jgi:hypothetical protein
VLFFDELDALAPRRQGGDNASSERVVNQLLAELDGAYSLPLFNSSLCLCLEYRVKMRIH